MSNNVKSSLVLPNDKSFRKLAFLKISSDLNVLLVKSTVGDIFVHSLLDTGASYSVLSKSFVEKLQKISSLKMIKRKPYYTVNATGDDVILNKTVRVKVRIHCYTWKVDFFILDSLPCDVLLALDFFDLTGGIIDPKNRLLSFPFDKSCKIKLFKSFLEAKAYPKNTLFTSTIFENKTYEWFSQSILTEEQRSKFEKILSNFKDTLTLRVGKMINSYYRIILKDPTPVRLPPYRLAEPKIAVVKEKVDELLKAGLISHSRSEYSSPCFLVKQGAKERFVIDYRSLNSKIAIDSNPIPPIESIFQFLGRAKFFTVIDLNKSYYQLPLHPKSKHLTAFNTGWQLFHWNVVPFGLATGGQRLMSTLDRLFANVKFKFMLHFIDDIFIYSENLLDHEKHVKQVLEILQSANLTVNPDKLKVAAHKVKILGHIIESGTVSMDPERIEVFVNYKKPQNLKQLTRFLGIIGFYSRFIPKFAQICEPLNALRRKDSSFTWSDCCQISFDKLKTFLTSAPILKMPDFNRKFVLQVDAAEFSVGGVLLQDFQSVLHPIAYTSRTLNNHERKYSAYQKECLAIVHGIDKFREYLELKPFVLQSDNQSLVWLLNHPRQLGMIGRWIAKIMSLKFELSHISGKDNVIADALSRLYEPKDSDFDDNSDIPLFMLLGSVPELFSDIKDQQRNDPELSLIINDIENNVNSKRIENYKIVKNTLVYETGKAKAYKIVVPKILQDAVFKYSHSLAVSGHLGILKTIKKVRSFCFWAGMERDLSRRVKECKTCQLSKPAQKTNVGHLSSDISKAPLEKIFIDFIGPLPRTKKNNCAILSIIDSFTKYCWLIPTKDQKITSVIKSLDWEVFKAFGYPKLLVSDNAPTFKSVIFKKFCLERGIKCVNTSPYYPCPNLSERLNRNIKSSLIAFHNKKHNTWDENLNLLQFAFNTAYHETIKMSPFSAMFGYQPNEPLKLIWKIDDVLLGNFNNSIDTRKRWEIIFRNLRNARIKLAKQYNKNRVPNFFKKGDMVCFRQNVISKKADKVTQKLAYRWSEPVLIDRWLTKVTARLVDPKTKKVIRKAHISQLKPYYGYDNFD